jgi:retinol dehydrogenase-12
MTEPTLSGKTILVTGATAGIGQVTARALAHLGAQVVLLGRNEARCQATVEIIQQANPGGMREAFPPQYLVADLSDMTQVRRVAQEFLQRFARLDVLVNNAGGFFLNRQLTADGYEMTFALNHLSYFLLTHLLLELIQKTAAEQGEARIVNVASDSHRGARINFDDLQGERSYSSFAAYGQSKLANVLFTFELDRRLQGTSITANALHPGFVSTQMGNNNGLLARWAMKIAHLFALSPEEGALTSIYLASSPEVKGLRGQYFTSRQPVSADPAAYDRKTAERLWQVSEELLNLR